MIYIFIDESGDTGNPRIPTNSKDFCLGACICNLNDVDEKTQETEKFTLSLNKKELRFSKLSEKEKMLTKKFMEKLGVKNFSAYSRKTRQYYGENLLRNLVRELFESIDVSTTERVKVFLDGTENAFFRKIYESCLRAKFPDSTLRFANSIKKPLIQVADFYAGKRRKTGK